MFVLDKSGSMRCGYGEDDGGDPSSCSTAVPNRKWDSLRSVVETVVTEFDASFNLGAKLFPQWDKPDVSPNGPVCGVAGGVEAGVTTTGDGAAVLAAIPDEDDIFGGTPVGEGMDEAIAHLQGLDEVAFPGSRNIILVMDDEPTCYTLATDPSFPNEVAEAIGLAAEPPENSNANPNDDIVPISTYVVGIDFEGGSGILSSFAAAGGTGFGVFDAQDTSDLEQAMATIAGSSVSCTVDIDVAPPFPASVEIDILTETGTNTYGPLGTTTMDCPDTGDGFVYDFSSTPNTITLCNQACTDLKDSVSSTVIDYDVDVKYFCTTG